MLLDILQHFTGLYVIVYDGQHALKFTLGRAKNVVGPGFHFKWPLIQKFKKEETKDTTLDLEFQIIQLKDELVYEVAAKVVYKIVNLRNAMIEVDDLEKGLKNRLTLSVQRVVQGQDRSSIHNIPAMAEQIQNDVKQVEEKWGFVIREFGFSHFAPSKETLEITQLNLLTQEKLSLFKIMRRENGLSEEAAVSLISGAVIALQRDDGASKVGEEIDVDAPDLDDDDIVQEESKEKQDQPK